MLFLAVALITCCPYQDAPMHEDAVELLATARAHLDDANYASAASAAFRAADTVSERFFHRREGTLTDDVPRWKDAAVLATARAIMVAAVVRSGGAVDVHGKEIWSKPAAVEASEEARALLGEAAEEAPKNALVQQVRAELQVRAASSRPQGVATLSFLGARGKLTAPEAMAALATALSAEGAEEAAMRYATLCEQLARWPKQCAPFEAD